MTVDITYHFPPDLFRLLVDTIPLLNPGKKDVVTFFRGAGVPSDIVNALAERLRQSPKDINKYEMVRVVLERLNSRGEATLTARREVLRRVVEFSSFESCWESDRLPAKGLVASIREVVQQKDAFTRMEQERNKERQARLAEAERIAAERREKLVRIDTAKKEFYALFGTHATPQVRGKLLETAVNNLFAAYDITVRHAFHLVGQEGQGIIEQIDGVIVLQGHVYFVEMKWYSTPIGRAEITPHIVTLMNRAEVRGLFISGSGYTEPAIQAARDVLQHKVMALATLEEIVQVLEEQADLADFVVQKMQASQTHRNPFFNPLSS